MTETTDAVEEDQTSSPAVAPADRTAWLARIEQIGEDAGYFQTLGPRHWAFFSDEDPVLLVTFETADSIRARSDGLPLGHAIAKEKGWSSLCLIADGETWYRDPALYRYFDRQVDDAFFEDFDRVVFYGAGMGAYAACAYSVTAPGATVIAVRPVATLDPAVAGWDPRFAEHRRLTFTDRYGFAPDMTEGAGQVFTVFDPDQRLDAMQAALFARPHVTALRCQFLGPKVEAALAEMKILERMLLAAGEGSFTPALFFHLYRQRRRHGPYLRNLVAQLESNARPRLAAMVARNATTRMQSPHLRQRLAEYLKLGVHLPPQGKVAKP